jgi:hypothetical protein
MDRKTIFGTATVMALVPMLLVGAAGAAFACPFDKSAQTTDQQTTASSQIPLPTDGTATGSKTGG